MDEEDEEVMGAAWNAYAQPSLSVSDRAQRLSQLIRNRQCRCSRYEQETAVIFVISNSVTCFSFFLFLLFFFSSAFFLKKNVTLVAFVDENAGDGVVQ